MGARTADPRRNVLEQTTPRRLPSRWFNSAVSGATSFVVHLVVIAILACLLINFPRSTRPDLITVTFEPTLETELDDPLEEVEGQVTLETEDPFASSIATAPVQPELSSGMVPADLEIEATASETGSEEVVILDSMLTPIGRQGRRAREELAGGRDGIADDWNFPAGVGYEGRQPGTRTQLALLNGGTLASERAVDRGLEWLARHQRPDGSWSFHHNVAACGTDCDGAGQIEGRTAATGLALLCFLGAGHTHLDEGPWQENVRLGIEWLTDQTRTGDLRCPADLAEPESHSGMYAQGIATMALCEAVGMTHDRLNWDNAEAAVQFIVRAQDRYGGGWRYEPNQPGDTSMLGWQIMALASARMSGIKVPDSTRESAVRFLDSVHNPSTDTFGYKNRSRGTTATTAIGQLCSMYLQSSLPPERRRMNTAPLVANRQLTNEYADYYVSQVLFQIGGPTWEAWNESLRDGLVQRQETEGHAAGSWSPRGRWADAGGRLYTTAMHVMTLEVYYRHLPLYQRDAFDALEPEQVQARRRREDRERDLGVRVADRDEPTATVEPRLEKDPQPESLRDLNVPTRYILNYPTAERFSAPIASTFEDAERDFVITDRGKKVGQHPNGGFGLPMLQVGGQSYFHAGADYGWYQTGAPVHAVAAGVVRLSLDSRILRRRDTGDEEPARRQNVMDWGNMIVIEHRLPDGRFVTTLYAHLGVDRLVQAGDIVAAGQQIGTIGRKSAAINGGYEPHLHFGVREGRIARTGATLFTLEHEGRTLAGKLEKPGEETMTVRFPQDASVPLGMVLPDHHAVNFEPTDDDGVYRMPSWVLWQSIPPEAQLVGYTPDLEGWLDPTAFLREHQATVLPATPFTLTTDTEPNGFPNMAGEPAPGWIIDEWIREPVGGTDVSQLRGKTIVMLCVQNNCRPSLLLALPTLADAAARFADADDVVLILHQTAFTDFRFNTAARFKQVLNQLPPNIAVAHSGSARSRPVILDDYGIRGTPWTLIIGPDGLVEFSGCLVDSNELIRMVEELRGDPALNEVADGRLK